MSIIDQAIAIYGEYKKAFSSGFLNADVEHGIFAGGVDLRHSQINLSFLTKDFYEHMTPLMNTMMEKMDREENQHAIMPLKEMCQRYPEMLPFLRAWETMEHEFQHVIQKHSHSSVFTLCDAMQAIESWELVLTFQHLRSRDGTWQSEQNLLSVLLNWEDHQLAERISRFFITDCNTALNAMRHKKYGLSLLHLIEGQAYIAGKQVVKDDGILPASNKDIYLQAWKIYKEFGGKGKIVFLQIINAALRYGDLPDDLEGSTFFDNYPHPVDVYIYLLNFVDEFEMMFSALDRHMDKTDLIQKEHARIFFEICKKKHQNNIKPVDSVIEFNSYIKKENENDENDRNFIETQEIALKHHLNFYSQHDQVLHAIRNVPDAIPQIFIDGLMLISDLIMQTIRLGYKRVTSPLWKKFDEMKKKQEDIEEMAAQKERIANQVALKTMQKFPYIYLEEFFLRSIVDPNSISEPKRFFLTNIEDEVFVKVWDKMDEFSHFEYQVLMKIPKLILAFLNLLEAKFGDGDMDQAMDFPNCCKKHAGENMPRLDEISPEFYDQCESEDALGKMFFTMFNRSIASCFKD